jgi:hypothetical protein
MKLTKIEVIPGAKIQKNIPPLDQDTSPLPPFTSKGAQKILSKTQSPIPDHTGQGSSEDKGMSRQVSRAEDFVVNINRSRQHTELSPRLDQPTGIEKDALSKNLIPSPSLISGSEKVTAPFSNPLTDGTTQKTTWEQLYATIKEILKHEPKESPLFRTSNNVLRMLRDLVYGENDLRAADFFRSFLMKTERNLAQGMFKSIQDPEYLRSHNNLQPDTFTSLLEELILVAEQSRGTKEIRPLIQNLLESTSTLKDSMESAHMLNSLTYSTTGELFFTIPFHINTHFLTGYLYLKLNPDGSDRKKKDRRDMLVVFFLDLPDLGGIRVDASLDRRNCVRVWVYMENMGALSFVQGRLPDLTKSLTDLGFQIEYVTVKAAPRFKLEEVLRKELVPGFLQGHIDVLI